MPAGSDAYYDSLFGPEAGITPSDVTVENKIPWMQRPELKVAGAGIFATWLLNKLLQTGHETGMRNIQRAGLRSQAEMVTPEALYYRAAQPQAQAEEAMALHALTQQITGGVLGPQLAKGEYMIGR